MSSMNRKIGIGVAWNMVNLVMGRGALALFTLLLAAFLTPEAFGLIAMVMVCYELGNAISDSGLGQAIVRSKTVSQTELSSVFIGNLVLSGLAYVLLFLAAPFVADFYGQPDLTALARVVGLVVFFNGCKTVQIAVLSRAMNFKVQMVANTTGVLVSGVVAVTMAAQGAGVWSLVCQILLSAAVSAAVLWYLSSWRPTTDISLRAFGTMFGFGYKLLLDGMLSVLYQNSYVLVIGKLFTAQATGLYFFARKITELIAQQLTSAVQQATYPAIASLQDDNEALRHKYRQIIQMMMFMMAPVMLLLGALAEPLFALAFQPKWQGAIGYLQILCVVGVFFALNAINLNILNVKGRSDLVLKTGLLKKTVNIGLLVLAIPHGLQAIVLSQVAGSALALVPNTYYSARLIQYGLADQMVDAFKPVLVALLAALVAWGIQQQLQLHPLLELIVAGGAGVACYLLASLAVKAEGFMMLLYKVRQRLAR